MSTSLAAINAVPVSKEELIELSEMTLDFRREHPDAEDDGMRGMMFALNMANNDGTKAYALWSRHRALAELISTRPLPGWIMENRPEDGGVFAQEALVAAAAVHPLIEVEQDDVEQWVFEPESFLVQVLACAKAERSS